MAEVIRGVRAEGGGVGGTTIDSFLNMLNDPDPMARRLSDSYLLDPKYAGKPAREQPGTALAAGRWPAWTPAVCAWTGPWPLDPVNSKIVRRSNALLGYTMGAVLDPVVAPHPRRRFCAPRPSAPSALPLAGCSGGSDRSTNGRARVFFVSASAQRARRLPGSAPAPLPLSVRCCAGAQTQVQLLRKHIMHVHANHACFTCSHLHDWCDTALFAPARVETVQPSAHADVAQRLRTF